MSAPAVCATLPRLWAEYRAGCEAGLHYGAQVYVSRQGRVICDEAWGEAAPGLPLSRDSLVLWLSSGKPLTAVAVMQLVERGLGDLECPVAAVWPEFAAGGKQALTPRHLLTHMGGFRWADVDPLAMTWDEVVGRIAAAPLEPGWTPGFKAGYHAYTSWFALAEWVRRLDGRPFPVYVREAICEPLGLSDTWVGMPAEAVEAYGPRRCPLPSTERPGAVPHPWSTPTAATICVPGGNATGPVRELGWFYEALAAGGQRAGERILRPELVAALIGPARVGWFDQTFRHTLDWGLGVIVNSNRYGPASVPYGFGPHASPRAFGHAGSQSSVGFCDPEHGLVVALVLQGMPGEPRHQRRMRALLAALYEDLGLGPEGADALPKGSPLGATSLDPR